MERRYNTATRRVQDQGRSAHSQVIATAASKSRARVPAQAGAVRTSCRSAGWGGSGRFGDSIAGSRADSLGLDRRGVRAGRSVIPPMHLAVVESNSFWRRRRPLLQRGPRGIFPIASAMTDRAERGQSNPSPTTCQSERSIFRERLNTLMQPTTGVGPTIILRRRDPRGDILWMQECLPAATHAAGADDQPLASGARVRGTSTFLAQARQFS
jgi:hypothetical protein